MKKTFITTISVLAIFTSRAHATIISGAIISGATSFTKLSVPFVPPNGPANTVGNDDFNTDVVYGFDEDQNVSVSGSPLAIDKLPSGATGSLAVGTVVASHYVFFDPAPYISVRATVTFDAPVLGIISSTSTLAASDYLANTGVTYLSPLDRGLEIGDSVTVLSANTIAFDVTAGSPGDYVRVLTAFSPGATNNVPEPASLGVLGLAVAAFLATRRKADPRRFREDRYATR